MHSNIGDLMGVTEQQFELLRAIDAASAEGGAKPKSIEIAYRKLTNKFIQKPNLFAQLKDLQKLGFVLKSNGIYQVNNAKLKQSLQKKKEDLKADIGECDSASKGIDQIFKADKTKIVVHYFDFEASEKLSCEKLNEVKFYKRPGNIPSLAYSEVLGKLLGTTEHKAAMKENCLKGNLKVQYILSLNPRRVFLKAHDALKNKELAYNEVKTCYDNLAKLSKMQNVEFRYLDANIDSVTLYLSDTSDVVALPIRSSAHGIAGFVWIESKDVCDAYKNMFDRLWESAKPLDENLIMKIARQKLKELRIKQI